MFVMMVGIYGLWKVSGVLVIMIDCKIFLHVYLLNTIIVPSLSCQTCMRLLVQDQICGLIGQYDDTQSPYQL